MTFWEIRHQSLRTGIQVRWEGMDVENHRERRGSDGVWRWGTAVALAFVLLQAWVLWTKGNHARDPYREPRGPSIKVGAVESSEFSFQYVWQRLQEFYRVGE